MKAQDDQDFLRMHFELLSKEAAKDPRSHFSRQSVSGITSPNVVEEARAAFSPGLVGPMSSTSLTLPSVEKALERNTEERITRLPAKVIRLSLIVCDLLSFCLQQTALPSSSSQMPLSPTFGTSSPNLGNGLVSPPEVVRNKAANVAPGTPNQTQNEVYVNSLFEAVGGC